MPSIDATMRLINQGCSLEEADARVAQLETEETMAQHMVWVEKEELKAKEYVETQTLRDIAEAKRKRAEELRLAFVAKYGREPRESDVVFAEIRDWLGAYEKAVNVGQQEGILKPVPYEDIDKELEIYEAQKPLFPQLDLGGFLGDVFGWQSVLKGGIVGAFVIVALLIGLVIVLAVV